MKYPIIVAAHNEADLLPRALTSIPKDAEPIVVANGCTDATADIARNYGAHVIELEQPAKMAAMKAGMRQNAAAILENGFSVLDADTEIVSMKYVSAVQRSFGSVACGVLVSPMLFRKEGGRVNISTSAWQEVSRYRHGKKYGRSFVRGANLIIRPTEETLEEMLELPDTLWPQEDTKMVDIHREKGIEIDSYNPRLAAVTSLRSHPTLWQRIRLGADACNQERSAWHASRAPIQTIEQA